MSTAEPHVDVGALEDFPEGSLAEATLSRRTIGILRRNGSVYAFASRCPHMGGPMCQGRLLPRLDGPTAGNVARRGDELVLACPWHGWEFDISSGEAIANPRYRVRTYPAWVQDGRVLVDPTSSPRAATVPA